MSVLNALKSSCGDIIYCKFFCFHSYSSLLWRNIKYCHYRVHWEWVCRSFRGRLLQARWPNQQCQSTEGNQLVVETRVGLNPTKTTPPCYNNTTLGNRLYTQRKDPNVTNLICFTCKNCSYKCAADCEHCHIIQHRAVLIPSTGVALIGFDTSL